MLKLLRMDLILNWRVLAFTYILWSALWLGGPVVTSSGDMPYGLWTGMVAVACAFLPVMMLGREDKFRAGALVCSLPVSRDAIVASRYVGGWLVSLVAALLSVLAMGALSLAGVSPLVSPSPALPVVSVVVTGLVVAVIMPLPIRFGITGVIGFLVGLQLLGVVVLMSSALFEVRAVQAIEAAVRSAIRAGRSVHATMGTVGFSLLLILVVAALNVVSCRLSAWIYRRRDF